MAPASPHPLVSCCLSCRCIHVWLPAALVHLLAYS
jgi:hypothetical protein